MRNLNINTDVLIVGAGPAGMSLAINLGKKNISTIVVDQKPKKDIGRKACGDALSPNSTRRLYEFCGIKQPYGEEISENLKTAHFRPVSDFELSLDFISQTIDRHKYGQRLLNSLKDYPWIEVKTEHKVIGTLIDDTSVIGCKVRQKDGKKIDVYAKIVVDCSGVTGIVRRGIPDSISDKFPKKLKKSETIVSYREIIETSEPHPYQYQMRIEYHDEMPPPGYFWIFSKGEKKLNVGVGWLLNENNKNANVKSIFETIRGRIFPNAKVIDGVGDTLPARLPLYSMVCNGFLTCGDSATLVNPISGEGHGPALLSAYYASDIVEKAVRNNDCSEEALWEYNLKIWDYYGHEGGLGIAVHKLLAAVPFSDFSFLFQEGIISQDDVDAIMGSTAVKLPIFQKIVKGMKRPKLLFKVAKGLLLTERIKTLSKKYPKDPSKFYKWKKKIEKIEEKEL